MSEKKCPACKSRRFYLKNPDDQYDLYEFEYKEGVIRFENQDQEHIPFILNDKTEVFCEACAWHDQLKKLDKP